mmetsp:Transcript_58171/g.142230  ORF Transcript_58171/g.142230 Transcript_58171/m.142230 type:complete len:122 (+) Transcript_58171:1409-1774(+)
MYKSTIIRYYPTIDSWWKIINVSYGRFEIPTGGYFLWVFVDGNIPFELDDPNFRLYCSTEHNVDFKTGKSCSSSSSSQDQQEEHQQPFASCIRLCFAYYDSETLEQGVHRLCRAIHEYSNR